LRDMTRREWITATGVGALGLALGAARAEVQPVAPEGMILIPGGMFLTGTSVEQVEELARKYGYHPSWFSGETPQAHVNLQAFVIDKYPVTNAQFAEFCAATGHARRPYWNGPEPPPRLAEHPVAMVNQADCTAYAQWAGKRLPTEEEWEKAARGTDGRMFPWGEEFDPEACQWNRARAPVTFATAPATAHPSGASPYGVMDMVGNVAEYCADGPGPGAAFIKGGSWMNEEIVNLRPAARNMSGFANNAATFYGFRCAKDVV